MSERVTDEQAFAAHQWLQGTLGPTGAWPAWGPEDEKNLAALLAERERDAVIAFVKSVNARAEADIEAGNPIEGAHHRAIRALTPEGEP